MQLEWEGAEESLSDGTDSRFYETEDINTELHNAVLNWFKFSKEGDACQEENINFIKFSTQNKKMDSYKCKIWITLVF